MADLFFSFQQIVKIIELFPQMSAEAQAALLKLGNIGKNLPTGKFFHLIASKTPKHALSLKKDLKFEKNSHFVCKFSPQVLGNCP